ncbi:MAG TPA: kelch repeat-containing protein, partial [Candidatus Kapabacteria bacterium]|nr:kelch repeat-containing protein [Candidatus Kapabacteria bacterium]
MLAIGCKVIAQNAKWQEIAPMLQARVRPCCALLPDGRILMIGGELTPAGTGVLSECEIYNPVKNTWSVTGSLHVPRFWGALATMHDGKIFVSGGYTSIDAGFNALATNECEIYDPATGIWQTTASMFRPRACFDAFTLPNGDVMVLG